MSAAGATRLELLTLWRRASVRGGLIAFTLTVSAAGMWLLSTHLPRLGQAAATQPALAGLLSGQAMLCGLWIAWIACLAMYEERGGDIVRRSVASGLSPTRIVLARVAALFIIGGVLLGLMLPIVMTGVTLGLIPASAITAGYPRLAVLLAAVTLLAVHLNLRSASRTASLALSLLVALGLAVVFQLLSQRLGPSGADVAFGSLGAVAAVALWSRCQLQLRYLPPEVTA